MPDDYFRVRDESIDLSELLELAREVYLGDSHASLIFDPQPPYGEHFHVECPLCMRGVCVALVRDQERDPETVLVCLLDEGDDGVCGSAEGEPDVIAWFRH